jgi:hypothetical protein
MTARKPDSDGTRRKATPGVTSWKPTIVQIRGPEHADELLSEFHSKYAPVILNRMYGVCHGRLHVEDLADTYQQGFTALMRWLRNQREIELDGETEAEAWIKLAYGFFRWPVLKRQAKLANALDNVSLCKPDGDENPETEPQAREVHPELDEARERVRDEQNRAMCKAGLTELEVLVVKTYLDCVNEFNDRDLFRPLLDAIRHQNLNPTIEKTLSRDTVAKAWRSGKAKLKRYLTFHASSAVWDFLGDSDDGIPRSPPERA